MSVLTPGEIALNSFLKSTTEKASMAYLIAQAPEIGWPIVKECVQGIVDALLINPTFDEITAVELAVKYLIDRKEFDKQFLLLKVLAESQHTADEAEKALENAENAMEEFFHRGPSK